MCTASAAATIKTTPVTVDRRFPVKPRNRTAEPKEQGEEGLADAKDQLGEVERPQDVLRQDPRQTTYHCHICHR